MDKIFKDKFKDCVNILLHDMFNNQESFGIVVSNRGWAFELPERLKEAEFFMIAVKEQAYKDSYIDEEGNIVLVTYFEDNKNFKTLYLNDIQGLFQDDLVTPIILKPFNESAVDAREHITKTLTKNPYLNFKEEELTEGVVNSLDAFIKNNKEMFSEAVKP